MGLKDLNFKLLVTEIAGWNQTKMGLKGSFLFIYSPSHSLLKSDQNGIESFFFLPLGIATAVGWNQTKMGLKVHIAQTSLERLPDVEIRPKWDWKRFLVNWVPLGDLLLKSDQNGIESTKSRILNPRSHRCWNQTKMGLKDNFFGHSHHPGQINVEIRPKWDWKFVGGAIVAGIGLCWNQTKMGLKVGILTGSGSSR